MLRRSKFSKIEVVAPKEDEDYFLYAIPLPTAASNVAKYCRNFYGAECIFIILHETYFVISVTELIYEGYFCTNANKLIV